jgi:hypothetical protein
MLVDGCGAARPASQRSSRVNRHVHPVRASRDDRLLAVAALAEVAGFIPDGNDEVPAAAFRTDEGRGAPSVAGPLHATLDRGRDPRDAAG